MEHGVSKESLFTPTLTLPHQGGGDIEVPPSRGEIITMLADHGINLITISGRKASVPEPDLRTGFLFASRTDT